MAKPSAIFGRFSVYLDEWQARRGVGRWVYWPEAMVIKVVLKFMALQLNGNLRKFHVGASSPL